MSRSRMIAGTLCVLLSLSATAVMAEDRALLVGIDHYRDARVPATPGAVADARAMADLVKNQFGFPMAGIRLLLNEEATRAAILEMFETWLIADTQAGDRVFFSYAGHGSQLVDDDGDEDDAYDETLAPFDIDPETGDGQIRDDVLDGLIMRLSGRRAVLLFDSCHSGTVTRSRPKPGAYPAGTGVRFLPRPEDFRRLMESEEGVLTRSGNPSFVLSGSTESRDYSVFDEPGRYGRPSGIVAISAAGPGQLAYPIAVDGAYRGAFSYVFETIYRQPAPSRGVFDRVKRKVFERVEDKATDAAVDAVLGKRKKKKDQEESSQEQGSSDPGSSEEPESEEISGPPEMERIPEDVTVEDLEQMLGGGLQDLQSSGQLEGDQVPQFDIISEYPIRDEPLYGGWEQEAGVRFNNPLSSSRVTIRTVDGRSTYMSGENITFEVSSTLEGFLYLLVFSEERVATCIFPNPDDSRNYMPAGIKRVPADPSYVFPVQEPYGEDLVMALVSQEARDLCGKVYFSWDEIAERVGLEEVREGLRERVPRRGIGVASAGEAGAYSGGPKADWQISTLALITDR